VVVVVVVVAEGDGEMTEVNIEKIDQMTTAMKAISHKAYSMLDSKD
jgi:hypothetical protein